MVPSESILDSTLGVRAWSSNSWGTVLKRILYSIAALFLVLSAVHGWQAAPASAAVGDSPDEGEVIGNEGFQGTWILGPGQRRWFRVTYPGNDRPLGITMHLREQDRDVGNSVTLAVNVRFPENEMIGEANADW